MTNPIAKAIAKAGVAMGYGSLEDYKGSSVEDMLESFAAIAQEKGPAGGGGAVYATFTEVNGTWSCDKTYDELKAAYDSGSIIFGCATGGTVFPMFFATERDVSGFAGTAILADGSPTITALYYYRLSVLNDGTVFVSKAVKEFLT